MTKALLAALLVIPGIAKAGCDAILATDTSKVRKAGDTMTGPLIMSGSGAYFTSGSSITGNHFGDGSGLTNIGTSALANSAVDTTKLASDAVITAKIITGAVTNTKIGALAVDTGKLAADSVIAAKIMGGAVDTTKIAAGAVDSSKLNSGLALPGGGSAEGPWTVKSTFTASLSAGIGGSPDSGLGVGVLQMKGPGTNGGGGKIRFGDAASSSNPYCGEQGVGDSDALDCTGRLGFIMQNGASKGVGIYATSLTQLVSTAALTLVGSGLSVNNVTGNSSPAIEVSSGIVIANGCLTVGGGQICSPPSSVVAYANLVSSYTQINPTSNTNTTIAAAGGLAAVSSVTFTLAATCNVQCEVDGDFSTTGTVGTTMRLGVLCDGAWPTALDGHAFGASTYAWAMQTSSASDLDMWVGPLKPFSLASGAHTCALFGANSSGTWNFRNATINPIWGCWCAGQ